MHSFILLSFVPCDYSWQSSSCLWFRLSASSWANYQWRPVPSNRLEIPSSRPWCRAPDALSKECLGAARWDSRTRKVRGRCLQGKAFRSSSPRFHLSRIEKGVSRTKFRTARKSATLETAFLGRRLRARATKSLAIATGKQNFCLLCAPWLLCFAFITYVIRLLEVEFVFL